MPPRQARPQLGLFDNPVRVFSLEVLTETVRALERERPGRTVDELSRAVFAELAMKRTRRAAELVAEAIKVARTRGPRAEINGSQWQASTSEVRSWALSAGSRPPVLIAKPTRSRAVRRVWNNRGHAGKPVSRSHPTVTSLDGTMVTGNGTTARYSSSPTTWVVCS